MKSPKSLKKGDTIGIISTARKIRPEEITPAVTLLESWGLYVRLGDHLFDEYHQFAGTTEARAEDFQNMIDDDSVQAILCARGGYGTVQIIDLIDFTRFKHHPKWIAGYSDVTVLHSHLHQVLKIQSIHSTMPINFPSDGSSNIATESLRKALFGEELKYEYPTTEKCKTGKTSGILCGGNLSILYSLLGSESSIDTEDKILFIEDLDEYLYHIDRMMMNMKRNGKLEYIKALLVGGMTEMNDNTIPYGMEAMQIIESFVNEYNIPVWFGFPAGHIALNHAMIMGKTVNINISEKSAIFVQK